MEIVRRIILRVVSLLGLNSYLDRERWVVIPMIKRKNGKTRSQTVIPFHSECSSWEKLSGPIPLFTIIMHTMVIPRMMSSESSRVFDEGEEAVAVLVIFMLFLWVKLGSKVRNFFAIKQQQY